MHTITTRNDTFDPRKVPLQVVRWRISATAPYLTAIDDTPAGTPSRDVYAVAGTDYGWLHNTSGDIRFWKSASGARHWIKTNY